MYELLREYYEELLGVRHSYEINLWIGFIILSSGENPKGSLAMIVMIILLVPVFYMSFYRLPTRH